MVLAAPAREMAQGRYGADSVDAMHQPEPDERTRQRSARACPVCGRHSLAVDEPPRIDVLGVQPYSDLVGMGDPRTPGPLGIVCLSCGTRWRDPGALDRGEPEPPEPEGGSEPEEGSEPEAPG